MRRIRFGRRLSAWFLDDVLSLVFTLTSATAIIFFAVATGTLRKRDFEQFNWPGEVAFHSYHAFGDSLVSFPVLIVALALIIPWTCYCLTEVIFAATPGKFLLGIAIGAASGEQATAVQRLIRSLIKNSSSFVALAAAFFGLAELTTTSHVLAVIVTLGMLLAMGPSRQTLHDKLADTAVYYREELFAAKNWERKIDGYRAAVEERKRHAPDPNDLFKPLW